MIELVIAIVAALYTASTMMRAASHDQTAEPVEAPAVGARTATLDEHGEARPRPAPLLDTDAADEVAEPDTSLGEGLDPRAADDDTGALRAAGIAEPTLGDASPVVAAATAPPPSAEEFEARDAAGETAVATQEPPSPLLDAETSDAETSDAETLDPHAIEPEAESDAEPVPHDRPPAAPSFQPVAGPASVPRPVVVMPKPADVAAVASALEIHPAHPEIAAAASRMPDQPLIVTVAPAEDGSRALAAFRLVGGIVVFGFLLGVGIIFGVRAIVSLF